ncbi:hypothetical protein [Hyphomicrobium sp. MC1]|nr:hypothetical protein [Hyphomicrobium sp. MC1]CCB65243.1 protein of unknown function [Hyphomicrobium sp. MC1]
MTTIELTTRRALQAFYEHFGRPPDEAEALLLAAAISDYFGIANPTARRH